ncbi:MAG: hypothetical protein DRR16_16545 [Candidatus Parabeggiatoa sp. nov. 3]|nr:MAG: hypothetical protein DRR16_16545 [Gammaproteobacteria bacterium]
MVMVEEENRMLPDKSGSEQKAPENTAKAIPKKRALGKAELNAFRQKIGVLADDIHTIGIAKTDIPGLQNITFEGASPKVRKLAGLPDATLGPIKSPILHMGITFHLRSFARKTS